MGGVQSSRRATSAPDLPVDVFTSPEGSLEVVLLADQSYPEDSHCGSRRPHRHAYHELIWSRRGAGSHLIDGQPSSVEPQQVTVIGRGQVHVFERAVGLDGAIVRFGDEILQVDTMARANPSWLVGFQGPSSVFVPDEAVAHWDALLLALAQEAGRSSDPGSIDVQRHLLCTLLLWVERWNEGRQAEHRALANVTGRRTKELITDRRMLEAARLLRFTNRRIGEVALRAGLDDPLYFSRSFKQYYGLTPTVYRSQIRGR